MTIYIIKKEKAPLFKCETVLAVTPRTPPKTMIIISDYELQEKADEKVFM